MIGRTIERGETVRDKSRREFIKIACAGAGTILISERLTGGFLAWVARSGEGLFPDVFGITEAEIGQVISAALSKGGDFAELFFEHRVANEVFMEDDIVKESDESVSLGVGVRVLKGKQTGYGYTSEMDLVSMKRAAATAASIASGTVSPPTAPLRRAEVGRQCYEAARPFSDAALGAKMALVKEAYAAAKGHDRRVTKVTAMLSDESQVVTIANCEGLLVSDLRPQVRLTVRATAEEGGRRGTGSFNAGGRVDQGFFSSQTSPKEIGKRAAMEAVELLSAADPVAGEQTVVLGKDQSGVMIHEAVGHPLEGDGNWKRTSIMWDKMGTTVASPLVTIYDDATIRGYRGSMNVDDEGTPTRSVPLIEKGKLVGYLHDRLSAKMLGVERNGHGRRTSYQFPPIPRMGNTVLAKGETPPEEIIRSVDKGFYASTYQGGQVEGTGKFTFSVNMGYLIEDGKLTRPVKNATLIGTNVDILKDIDMVGNDVGFFLGTCGKQGQWAAVTAGTPTLRIKKMTVGGRR